MLRAGEGGAAFFTIHKRLRTVFAGSDLSGIQSCTCGYISALLALVLECGQRYPGVLGEKLRYPVAH